jgi:hypothetical protein
MVRYESSAADRQFRQRVLLRRARTAPIIPDDAPQDNASFLASKGGSSPLSQLERDVNYLILLLLLLLLQGSAASDFTAFAVQLGQTEDRTETPALGAGAGTARRFS